MGLFSSKEKTTVGTVFTRAIKDDEIPNYTKAGILKAVFQNGNMADYLLEEMGNSIGKRAEAYYDYGKKYYSHGLPSGEKMSATQGRSTVQQVLDSIEGQSVFIDYYQYGPPNALHIAWMKLIAVYGYNPETNELPVLSAQKGVKVYLNDMAVVIRSAVLPTLNTNVLDQWGVSARAGYTPTRKAMTARAASLVKHAPIYSSPTATVDYVAVNYCWQSMDSVDYAEGPRQELVMHYEDTVVGFSEYDSTKDFFHVKYKVNGVTKYWLYQAGLGTYPSLDNVFNQPAPIIGSYFPFAYFRFNKKSEIEDKTTQEYKTSKKLLKKLGMNYDQIAESIDKNPDIKDVEQAMLMFAVPAHSTLPLQKQYLYDFFDAQYYASEDRYTSAVEGAIRAEFGANSDENRNTTIIQDRRFKMALTNDGMHKERIIGSIGPVGTYANGMKQDTREFEYFDTETNTRSTVTEVTKYHVYQKQISSLIYEEIQIVGLRTVFFVYGAYTTIGDENDDILMIPLDLSIIKDYQPKDKETLYTQSLYYVFNSRTVTKVKWYQSGLFQAIIIIVSLVVLIASYGNTWQQFAASVAAGTATSALILSFAIGVIKAIAISYSIKLFVKEVGMEAAFVIAIVAAIAGAYQYISQGANANAPWVKELLDVSTSLAKGVGQAVKDGIGDLLDEYNNLLATKTENDKLLETAQELLTNKNRLSPLTIFGESPTEYYNRTVHSGNIGIVGIDAISVYVEASVRLPKLSDTLNDLGENFGTV